jgi:hypothetical protein
VNIEVLRKRSPSERAAYLQGIRMVLEMLKLQFQTDRKVMSFVEQTEMLQSALERTFQDKPMSNEDFKNLDSLAAEKIMGWRLPKEVNEWTYWMEGKEHIISVSGWHPTREIWQAWELLEKFDRFEVDKSSHVKGQYVVYVYNSDRTGAGANAVTAPLAITKACLKAVGEAVNG